MGVEGLDKPICWGFCGKKIAVAGRGWKPHLKSETCGTRFTGGPKLGRLPTCSKKVETLLISADSGRD